MSEHIWYSSTDAYTPSTGSVYLDARFAYPTPTVPSVRIEFILCPYCKSKMKFTLSNCTQCGAPMPLENR